MARPTEYREAYAEGASKLARLGATDAEIADFFGVDVRTIYRWKNTYDEFCQALKAGKDEADARVERSLYHRAIGYEQEAVKIFMPGGATAPVYANYVEKVAPDTTAAIFWLKNRKPKEWRDRQEIDHTTNGKDMPEASSFSAIEALTRKIDAIAERSAKAGEPSAE